MRHLLVCTMLCSACIMLGSGCAPWPAPTLRTRAADPPPILVAPADPKAAPLTLVRVGHASVLLDFDGAVVLTDPWFTESREYHHGEPLAMSVGELPRLTAVVVSHDHYDHFDVDAFAAYPDKEVPIFVPAGLVERTQRAGFRNVRGLAPWQSAEAGPLTITAAPGAHAVPEITFVIQGKGRTVYFGGDTRLVPALDELPRRFPQIDLAVLPINGLRVFGRQVVMNDEEAARLAGMLHAPVAVPIHYAFHGGWLTDTFVLGYGGTPAGFVAAVRRLAPSTRPEVLLPGQRLTLEAPPDAPRRGSCGLTVAHPRGRGRNTPSW